MTLSLCKGPDTETGNAETSEEKLCVQEKNDMEVKEVSFHSLCFSFKWKTVESLFILMK
jgi:hypothetical protein